MDTALIWLASSTGRLVAALALFALVAAAERLPVGKDMSPLAKRLLAVVLAVVPAIATALYTGVPLAQVGEAALTAFVGATGINALLPGKLAKP